MKPVNIDNKTLAMQFNLEETLVFQEMAMIQNISKEKERVLKYINNAKKGESISVEEVQQVIYILTAFAKATVLMNKDDDYKRYLSSKALDYIKAKVKLINES